MVDIKIPLQPKKNLALEYKRYEGHFESALFDVQKILKASLQFAQLSPTFKARVKTFDSYYQKMQKRVSESPQYKNWYQITDILGIRIICPFMSDLPIVEEILKREFIVREREKKGAEFSFKEFGYDSVHYLLEIPLDIREFYQLPDNLVCEVQLRTILQDAWAEVEHELVYKSDYTPFDESLRRKLAALNANLSLADMIFHEIREYQRELKVQMKKRKHDFQSLLEQGLRPRDESFKEYEIFQPTAHFDVIDGHLLKAIHAHNKHQYSEAIEIYNLLLELDPKPRICHVVFLHLGMAKYALGHHEEALSMYSKSLDFPGDQKRVLYYRGICHQGLKNYLEALSDFEESLKFEAHQPEVLLARAQVYVHIGDYSEALHDADEILALLPEDKDVIDLKNMILRKLGV